MPNDQKRVLIVDDDPDFALAARAALESRGYAVAECREAREALAKMREFRPDLLILDVMMETGTAGFDVSYQVRADKEFTNIPILMVSAIHQSTPLRFSPDKDGSFLPVERFLDKPVPAEKLLGAVGELLAQVPQKGK
jgi:CheY-like chemotaxis protein